MRELKKIWRIQMKRQALKVSINELNDLVSELTSQLEEQRQELEISNWDQIDLNKDIIVPIVNYEEQSDTWKLE